MYNEKSTFFIRRRIDISFTAKLDSSALFSLAFVKNNTGVSNEKAEKLWIWIKIYLNKKKL